MVLLAFITKKKLRKVLTDKGYLINHRELHIIQLNIGMWPGMTIYSSVRSLLFIKSITLILVGLLT